MEEPWTTYGMTREQFEKQWAQMDRLFGKAMSHTTTLLWFTKGLGRPPKGLSGASIFFVDLGAGPIAITAAHVYLPYAERKSSTPNLVCHVGGRVLYLEDRLIDCDQALDIATFKVDPAEVNTEDVEKVVHAAPRAWPSAPPTLNEPLIIGGFPADGREMESPDDLMSGFDRLLFEVTSVNERQISCHWPEGLLPPEKDLGGLSGGPIWRQSPDDPNQLDLVGIVSECSSTLRLLCAARADLIEPSGKIRRPVVR